MLVTTVSRGLSLIDRAFCVLEKIVKRKLFSVK